MEAHEAEAFSQKIVSSAIYNKDNENGGYRAQEKGQYSGIASKLTFGLGGEKYFNVYDPTTKDNTVAMFVQMDAYARTIIETMPLEADRVGITKKKGLFGGGAVEYPWEKGLTALSFEYWGEDMDEAHRTGPIGGSIFMKDKDADEFKAVLEKDPRALFDLVRLANGGPLKKKDGILKIRSGNCVKIVPNTQYGGSQSVEIKTPSFPADYNPNSLM